MATKSLEEWERHLWLREAAPATIEKYVRAARGFLEFLAENDRELDLESAVLYRKKLAAQFAPATVNTVVAALNGYFSFCGHADLRLCQLRIHKGVASARKELSIEEYRRLVRAARAQGDEESALLAETLCSTGIRVSELASVTVDAVRRRLMRVVNKGSSRLVHLPPALCKRLMGFARRRRIKTGAIFISRAGHPIHRSVVWRRLKRWARAAHVQAEKIFPHNLRHLFATVYYKKFRDIDTLSSILGHSCVETTRIYLNSSEEFVRRQVASLGLLVGMRRQTVQRNNRSVAAARPIAGV